LTISILVALPHVTVATLKWNRTTDDMRRTIADRRGRLKRQVAYGNLEAKESLAGLD
jgi:hypothetical protein